MAGHPLDRVGQTVRFSVMSRVGGKRIAFEGVVQRWRQDRRGRVGWFDVKCADGLERSVRPTQAETVS